MSQIADLDEMRLPRHVAIVMDGNGRWAQSRKKPRLYGHKAGAASVREVVQCAAELGIATLTLYAFSSENWNRPDDEVSGLMGILYTYLQSELNKMLKNNIRLFCIGDLSRLPVRVRSVLLDAMEQTKANSGLTLNLALSYGARDELVMAAKAIAEKCQGGTLTPDDINQDTISQHLYTAPLPELDLFIRTGGEKRLSNFLLWQVSYAEIIFTDTMWPEFRRDAFLACLSDYQTRERRFGRTGAQVQRDAIL